MEICHPHFAQVGRPTALTSTGKQDLDLLAHKFLIPGMSLLRERSLKGIWGFRSRRLSAKPRKVKDGPFASQMRLVDL
jgi:hypothetical protein